MADALFSEGELEAITSKADSVIWTYRDKLSVPPLLFQYTSLDAAFQIIGTCRIWCSNLRYSNDPTDALYGKQLLDEVLSADPDLRLAGLRTVITGLDPYAASFSADGDLLPQWRAYCRDGRGVALGIEFEVLKQRQSMILTRVIYEETEQRAIINDTLNVFRAPLLAAQHDEDKVAQLLDKLGLYLAIVRSTLKSPAYESEREYRLLDLLPNNLSEPNAELNFRVSGGSLVPYLIADLTASAAPAAHDPVREVRIGPCLDYALLDASFRLFCDQNERAINVSASTVKMKCS